MHGRWRGRRTALAIAIGTAMVLCALVAAVALAGPSRPTLRVSLPDGRVLARLTLPDDGAFTLRYRNSLYGTVAGERFEVMEDGRMRLVELEAEQLAVLEEYYAIDTPARRSGRGDGGLAWEAQPAHQPVEGLLRVAATDRGERTVHVDGAAPLELWHFVSDAEPSVLLEIER